MNLGDLRLKVNLRLGLRQPDRFYAPDLVDKAINDAIERIDSEHKWTWLETSTTSVFTAGDIENTLPVDWRSTKGVFWNGNVVTPVSIAELLYHQERTGTQPMYYYIGNGTLSIAPEPSQSVTLVHVYYKASPELEADDDEPLIPRPWQQVIIHAAVSDLAPDREDYDLAAKAEAMYQDAIAKMRKSLRPTGQPFTVRVRPGSQI